ncbi:DUF7064 domain-containing protein [Novosphingobium colocasiae]|uniref:Uncharacterized protein n=1 Tax=Novosphingobium colocasiae TaxID=1256513 RepID=A0A918PA03_9SPHN|nr:hypothetical protein [Novosphingobium colocasiae]GGY91667.1 hypothetical protein GCM10011614_02970 [Novosphingobium colocasiae]
MTSATLAPAFAMRSDLPPVPAADDNRHKLRDVPHCREANALMFQLPERGLAGFVYFWVDKDGMAGAAAYAFGPGIAVPVIERYDSVKVPDDMDFTDWDVQGLTARLGDVHQAMDFTFAGDRVQIDARYEAFHPPYAFSSHKDGCPPYYADDRTEQHGRVTGTMVLDGEEIALDHFMQRDHSWGPRVWGLNQHYKWFHATTANAYVHFFEMQSFGRALVRGFVARDGLMSEIRRIDYDYAFDDTMHQKRFDVVVTDAAGRETRIETKIYATTEFQADPMIYLKEGAVTVAMVGEEGTGWCEFCWNRNYFDFAQQYVGEYF